MHDLKPKGQDHSKNKKPLPYKHTKQKQYKQEISPVTGVQLICQICCDGLITITEQGQQRSKSYQKSKDSAPGSKKTCSQPMTNEECICPVWCPTDVKYVMNDLLTMTERGQQRS